jgi:hypothetical protein
VVVVVFGLFALVLLVAGRAVAVVVVVLDVEELEAGRVVVVVLEVEVVEAGRVLEVRAALCCAFW